MRRVRLALAAAAALSALSASACGGGGGDSGGAPFPVNFDRADFDSRSADIDNRWSPLKVGTESVLTGRAFDGADRIDRRVVSVITDQTKEVAGVRSRIEWDRDYNDGVLGESELAFFAQDKAGNVWHLGEYVEAYDEEGVLDGAQAWLVGYLKGAKAGIEMRGKPRPGTPPYAEGFAPAPFSWNDHARVLRTGARTCVPVRCYRDVVITKEFEPAKPGAFQTKYYALGLGNVRVGWGGPNEEEKETLALTRLDRLDSAAMARARAEARRMEARAYVYGRTPPMTTSSR